MQARKAPETPAAGSSDVERARLRAAGLSDDEITRIFATRGQGVQPAGGGAVGVPQLPVSGAMGNFSAIWAHARNIIPTMAAQIVTVFNTSAGAAARISALLSVMVKAAFVCVFAYVVALEFSQLRSATDRAHAEACQARITQMVGARPLVDSSQLTESQRRHFEEQDRQWARDCQ
jgi:hypothetical protein